MNNHVICVVGIPISNFWPQKGSFKPTLETDHQGMTSCPAHLRWRPQKKASRLTSDEDIRFVLRSFWSKSASSKLSMAASSNQNVWLPVQTSRRNTVFNLLVLFFQHWASRLCPAPSYETHCHPTTWNSVTFLFQTFLFQDVPLSETAHFQTGAFS